MTSRRYVLQEHGEEAFERYVAAAPEAIRETLREPVVSRWYPEETLRDALKAFHQEIAGGDDANFSRVMEQCAVLGVHWFLQILASVTTPRYLLRLMPAALAQIRRGPVRVHIEARERSATLTFTGQPYADDPRYMLSTPALMHALLSLCLGPGAQARLTHVDASTQVCELSW